MNVLVFTISNWNFAIDNNIVSQVIHLETEKEFQVESDSFFLDYQDSKIQIFNLAKKLSLRENDKAEKIILFQIGNKSIGVLVDKILGVEDISFEKLPPYLVFKGNANPLTGINENGKELISLLNNKVLENIRKDNL